MKKNTPKSFNNLILATTIAFLLSGVGILLIVYFSLNKGFNDGSFHINPQLANNYGGFIGGLVGPIFSLAGFILLYVTILSQRNSFQAQQLESKFFELIRYHRENVKQMEHRIPSEMEKYVSGPAVFMEMLKQFNILYRHIAPMVQNNPAIRDSDKEKSTINIAYRILFMGVTRQSIGTLKKLLKGYGETFIDQVIIK